MCGDSNPEHLLTFGNAARPASTPMLPPKTPTERSSSRLSDHRSRRRGELHNCLSRLVFRPRVHIHIKARFFSRDTEAYEFTSEFFFENAFSGSHLPEGALRSERLVRYPRQYRRHLQRCIHHLRSRPRSGALLLSLRKAHSMPLAEVVWEARWRRPRSCGPALLERPQPDGLIEAHRSERQAVRHIANRSHCPVMPFEDLGNLHRRRVNHVNVVVVSRCGDPGPVR
jgi:hypothetical protein